MKLTLTLFLLLLATSAVAAQTAGAAKPAAWGKYTIPGRRFAVTLPTLPAMHIGRKHLSIFDDSRETVQLGSYAEGVVYVVYVLENSDPRISLQQFIAEQTGSGVPRSVATERDITQDGLAGRVVTFAGPTSGAGQYFNVQDRLYEFWAFGASAEDARVKGFFSSISFHNTKGAVEVEEGAGSPFQPAVQEARPEDQLPNGAYIGNQVDQKLRLAMKPEPTYTDAARQNAIAGTVVLKCIFKYDGSVVSIRTVSDLPYGLTEKAIEAAKRIKFIPAVKDGKFVSMWIQLEYNFNLY
jgi:TonB family protein